MFFNYLFNYIFELKLPIISYCLLDCLLDWLWTLNFGLWTMGQGTLGKQRTVVRQAKDRCQASKGQSGKQRTVPQASKGLSGQHFWQFVDFLLTPIFWPEIYPNMFVYLLGVSWTYLFYVLCPFLEFCFCIEIAYYFLLPIGLPIGLPQRATSNLSAMINWARYGTVGVATRLLTRLL